MCEAVGLPSLMDKPVTLDAWRSAFRRFPNSLGFVD
jgi:hypothetical protein